MEVNGFEVSDNYDQKELDAIVKNRLTTKLLPTMLIG